jgi:hypothetical protein
MNEIKIKIKKVTGEGFIVFASPVYHFPSLRISTKPLSRTASQEPSCEKRTQLLTSLVYGLYLEASVVIPSE